MVHMGNGCCRWEEQLSVSLTLEMKAKLVATLGGAQPLSAGLTPKLFNDSSARWMIMMLFFCFFLLLFEKSLVSSVRTSFRPCVPINV